MYMLKLLEETLRELYLELKMVEHPELVPDFQIILMSGENPKNLRNLKSDNIGKIVKV